MPLTKRQFELGLDEEAEDWMRQAYQLLAGHRDLAYSAEELRHATLGESSDATLWKKFDHALYILAEIGAVEVRIVDGLQYLAFLEEVDTESWVKKVFRL